jgi:hypothetical protein
MKVVPLSWKHESCRWVAKNAKVNNQIEREKYGIFVYPKTHEYLQNKMFYQFLWL